MVRALVSLALLLGTSSCAPSSVPCTPRPEWARFFRAESISLLGHLRTEAGPHTGADLDFVRVGDRFAVSGRFDWPRARPRVTTVPARNVNAFLCTMASRRVLDVVPPPPEGSWTDDYPFAELVFRFSDAPPVRAYFVDQHRQWWIRFWGQDGRVLEKDPPPPKADDLPVEHWRITRALEDLFGEVGPPDSIFYERVASHKGVPSSGGPQPEAPASLVGATSLRLDGPVGETVADTARVELVRVGNDAFATIRFGSGGTMGTYPTRVPSSTFDQWIAALEDIRRNAERMPSAPDPEDRDPTFETPRIPKRRFLARVPGTLPVAFHWEPGSASVTTQSTHALAREQGARLLQLHARIMQALDSEAWLREYQRDP